MQQNIMDNKIIEIGVVLIGLGSVVGVIVLSALGKPVPDVLGLLATGVISGIFGASLPKNSNNQVVSTPAPVAVTPIEPAPVQGA